MRKNWRLISLAALMAMSFFVAGCASTGDHSESRELQTSSDQTDNQKRARIRMQLAIGYFEQRQFPVALDEIKLALQADPNFVDAYSVRALVYMEMGETRLADENFKQAMKLAPNSPDIANNYGWYLCQNGRESESLAYFDSALKNKSYQSPAKALHNAGVCTMKLKDVAGAEAFFLDAFKLDPSSLPTAVNLAQIYYQRQDYQRSQFYVGRAVKGDLLTPEVLWLAIKVEHKLGNKPVENSLGTQLRRRHPTSRESAAYQRGAFDE
ncbi:type IV pilus biogenesis/stability protein PilW [soil metagenome]